MPVHDVIATVIVLAIVGVFEWRHYFRSQRTASAGHIHCDRKVCNR